MIELEALAACWAMKKCNMFVQGLPHFTLLTDHQPLIPILNSMGIADVENPRLQRLMMKMLPYSFTAEWVKGKDHLAADALSRFPVDQPSLDDELCDVHAEAAVKIQFADKSVEDLQLQEVSKAQQNDPQLSQVTEYIRCGWPDSLQEVATIAKPVWPIRHNLYLITPTSGSSITLMNGRTVIPLSLQKKMLLILHEGHQGIDRTCHRARDSIYWPDIDREIEASLSGTSFSKFQGTTKTATNTNKTLGETRHSPF